MRLDSDGDLTNFSHGILGWVIGFFLDSAFSFTRFRPVFFKYAIVDPFLT
jgi:hypothetical protein